jgi:hypothetical protein
LLHLLLNFLYSKDRACGATANAAVTAAGSTRRSVDVELAIHPVEDGMEVEADDDYLPLSQVSFHHQTGLKVSVSHTCTEFSIFVTEFEYWSIIKVLQKWQFGIFSFSGFSFRLHVQQDDVLKL